MSDGAYRTPAERDPDEPPVDPAKPWALQTWASRRSCPVCREGLFALRKEGWRVDACAACGGVWLPRSEAERMLALRSQVPATLGKIAREYAVERPSKNADWRCPDCGLALAVTTTTAGPVVDVCATHGTWLDAGELETISRPFTDLVVPEPSEPASSVEMSVEEGARRLGIRGKLNALLCALAGGVEPFVDGR